MPFVRFARDKRGYEHIYLVHAANRKGKSSKARVLYWFRTPPGVKVGREPFDQEVRRELEKRYPDLTFDWDAIVSTPMPAPEIDWRELRRLQRAAKEARAALEQEELEEEKLPDGAVPAESGPVSDEMALATVESIGASIDTPPAGPSDSIDRDQAVDVSGEPVEGDLAVSGTASIEEPVTPEQSRPAEDRRVDQHANEPD